MLHVLILAGKPVFVNADLTAHEHKKAEKPTIGDIRRDPGGERH
jgi:hypothetical protein